MRVSTTHNPLLSKITSAAGSWPKMLIPLQQPTTPPLTTQPPPQLMPQQPQQSELGVVESDGPYVSDDESSLSQSITAANERKRAMLYSLGTATLQYYTPPSSAKKVRGSKPLPPIPAGVPGDTVRDSEQMPPPGQSVADITLGTLVVKMEELRRKVETAEEPEELKGLFEALKSCADAVAAMKRVHDLIEHENST
ncbi:hypothetical protein BC937DRAFT_90744 [Endogone sp. FLAS-F59071]|nr:hypothetical protein BC937DRAFT_90744 [Endogone sp. FLAS-F59071]|eukprot:RUS21984.1 hypothetical protein BC937DRAFT_90744 [Endogone sp. FLAS-F59071]